MGRCRLLKSFNSRPHKEVDLACPSFPDILGSFNSRPHKEVDGYQYVIINHRKAFNSRPHKEVDITANVTGSYTSFFQLTTSQGGRHGVSINTVKSWTFNSRPHKEVDKSNHFFFCSFVAFNSRPHKEVDVFI